MFVAAAEEYTRFCDRYPGSELCPRAIFLAGESWMQAGKAKEALETFQRYLDSYPEGDQVCRARFYRGRILKKLESYSEAASEFLLINDEYPGCALAGRALLEAGESLLYAGNPEDASLILRKLIKISENDELLPMARYTLALALINMERELEAYSELETLIDRYPGSPLAGMALLKLGRDALSSGRYGEAEGYFSELVENRREENLREKGLYNLIEVFSRTGDRQGMLENSIRYLSLFEKGQRRDRVFGLAINAAHETGDGDRAL
jgi:TolA-binding protein